MTHFKNIFIAIIFSLAIISCGKDKSHDSKSAEQSDPDLTGERFFDSAATKIMKNTPNMTRIKANCVVKTMTEDGRFGLGEINQMDLSAEKLNDNASQLVKSYKSALSNCQ